MGIIVRQCSLRITAALQTGCCPCPSLMLSQLLSAHHSVITGFWFSASRSRQPVWLCQSSLPVGQCPLHQISALATDRPMDDLPLDHVATRGSVTLPEHEACWEGAGRGPGSSSGEGLGGGIRRAHLQNLVPALPAWAQASGSDAAPRGPGSRARVVLQPSNLHISADPQAARSPAGEPFLPGASTAPTHPSPRTRQHSDSPCIPTGFHTQHQR